MTNNRNFQNILFEAKEQVGVITLNRPDKMNSWTMPMIDEMMEALNIIEQDDSIRAAVLTGAGKAFSSGFDMDELVKQKMTGEVPWAETNGGLKIRNKNTTDSIVLGLSNLSKPIIAAINGAALGIGFSYTLACDIRIMADHAWFSTTFIDRGLIPEAGVTYFLPRLVGIGKAKKLIFTGEKINALEAEKMGLVEEVVPADMLMERSMELASAIAAKPPLAIALAKQTLYKGASEPDLAAQIDREFYLQSALIECEDVKEGVQSFLEKRPPVFKGR